MTKKIKVFNTFTGIGSVEMALKNIDVDFEVVGISEVDRYALLAYDAIHTNHDDSEEFLFEDIELQHIIEEFKDRNIAYNFSTGASEIPRTEEDIRKLFKAHIRSLNYGDIRLIDEKELPDFDLFSYSFPCKNISVAGRQEGLKKDSDTQSSLLWECERIIEHKRPQMLLMENVKNLVGKNHIKDFEDWISILEDLGYHSYWKVLDASNFGLPQHRERVMMVSLLDASEFEMPEGNDLGGYLIDMLEDYNHIPENLLYHDYRWEHIVDTGEYGCYLQCLGHITNLKGEIKIHSNKRVYSAKGWCPTLNSMNGGNRQPKIYVGGRVRRMTPLECWRVMGYSDEDFYKAKTVIANNKLYERAGRGIAVPMLEEIFKNLLGD